MPVIYLYIMYTYLYSNVYFKIIFETEK